MSIHDRYAEQRIAAAEHDLVEAHKRIRRLEGMVRFMEPFFMVAINDCGCPNDYYEPHGCDDECKALREYHQRIRELGIEVDR